MPSSFSFNFLHSKELAHNAIEQLLKAPWLAVDMEFYWRSTYYPQLCLLQVADAQQSIVIDTLSPELDAQAIKTILQQLANHPCLVFHSGSQDWKIFHQYCGAEPKHVIDIQYAGIYYGLGESPSLGRLTEEVLQYQKHSEEQCSDWRQRPLTEGQIAYAKADVESIASAYISIQKKLDDKQRQALLQDSQNSLSKVKKKIPIEQLGTKLWGYKNLSPRQKVLLQELVAWRELLAQNKDCPARWLCDNNVLLACAEIEDTRLLSTAPKSVSIKQQPMQKKRGSFASLSANKQQQIAAVHARVQQYTEQEINDKLQSEFYPETLEMTEFRRQTLNKVRSYIHQIIHKNPLLNENMIGKKHIQRFLQQPDDNSLMSGWRYYFIGEQLLTLSQAEIKAWSESG